MVSRAGAAGGAHYGKEVYTDMAKGGSVYFRGKYWWYRYSSRGVEVRASSRSNHKEDAVILLKRAVLQAEESGRPRREDMVTLQDLATSYLATRELSRAGADGMLWSKSRVRHLLGFLGASTRAIDVTSQRLQDFATVRLKSGASSATVNKDLLALSRMYTLAIRGGRLTRKPHCPLLPQTEPRQGFVSVQDFEKIASRLPPDIADVARFLFLSAWRRGEALTLEWSTVNRAEGAVTLRPRHSKTRAGRVLILTGLLQDIIDRRWRERVLGNPRVFTVSEDRLRRHWLKATREAGLPGILVHDLRRSAIRNMVRAGVREGVAMAVSGHKTRAVFDRYNITSEDDLRDAGLKLQAWLSARV